MNRTVGLALSRSARGFATAAAAAAPAPSTVGFQYNKKFREFPHRMLWRRKNGFENSSWNQCKKSHEALATNFSGISIADRVLFITDCDSYMVNVTLAAQKRGAQVCLVPAQGLTSKKLETYIEQLRPTVIFLGKDKVSVPDPMAEEDSPEKMTLDIYSMIWKIFPISTLVDGMPLASKRYEFVKSIVLCDQAEALNQHDMITNIKYFETPRDQDYYESPLVYIAMHLSPDFPALSTVDSTGKWTTHTHNSLVQGGAQFATLFGNNERVLLLPGAESTPCGVLTMYAALEAHAVLCYGEDQMVTKGDCKRVTRAVYQHEATTMVGTKAQWEYLLKFGDAPTKREDSAKNWFKTLKWVSVFLDDLEPAGDLEARIKRSFGVDRVEMIRGSPETLNFTSKSDGQLASNLKAVVKDASDMAVSAGVEGSVWVQGPHVTAQYWNHIGLMSSPKDANGFVKLPYTGKMKPDGGVTITGASPLNLVL